MAQLKFKIIGQPIAKGRPRFFRAGSYTGTYTPANTRRWEEFVHFQAIQYRPKSLWQGPIAMTLIFLMPRPKSLPKKVVHHIKKPDLDNLAKSVKDALQGIIYRTDSQIVTLNIEKKYAVDEYGVEIEMEEVEG